MQNEILNPIDLFQVTGIHSEVINSPLNIKPGHIYVRRQRKVLGREILGSVFA